jgi:hypothetical protein
MVEGDLPVDEYSLDELQRFDAVFLQGYTYNDRARAWNLLERYVRQGGALYVDTGWQWTVPDWESDPAPEVLPVARMTWTDYGTTNDYRLEAPEISGDIDASEFASLTWDGQPWGVSGMSREEVREWGQVVLSAAGNPLIVAGRYGDGRVIWSGMNLVAHAYDKDNQEEVRLLHSLIAWLIADRGSGDYAITVTREDPDRVEFHASLPATQRTTLYWREAYYPAWHAYLVSTDGNRQRLPIYRGGPRLMLIPIPASSGNLDIVLRWETPLVERLAAILSMLTLGALCGFVADGLFLRGRVTSGIRDRLNLRRRRDKPRGRVEWLESSKSEEADMGHSASASGLHTSPAQPAPMGSAPGTGDEEQMGSLWEKYVSSVEQDKERNAQAEGMIRRRRRSSDHGDGSENSR